MRGVRPVFACAAVLALLLAAGVAWLRAPTGMFAGGRAALQQQTAKSPTEQEWIVADVSAAIEQMVWFALRPSAARPGTISVTTSPASAGALARFEVERPGRERAAITITDHLWAPAAYATLASPLSGAGTACGAVWTAPVVDAMLDPRPAVILRESARISARLQANMRCADAHDEAALLLGAFALREAAGSFSDTRRVMSRMTAHMAIADALLKGETSIVRRLADAVLLTLAGRQQSALEVLAALEVPAPNADVLAWIRSLRLRNTFDWRTMPKDKAATLLEQLSLLRAIDASLGDGQSLEMFDHLEGPPDIADWSRLILQHGASVQSGNRFTEQWMAAELSEAVVVIQTFNPVAVPATPESIVIPLNADPGAGPVGADGVVHVIDQGTWAAATERHLMRAVAARHTHLARRLGLPGDARAFRDDASRAFSALKMYPLAAVAIAFTRDEAARALPQAARLIEARRDLVTDGTWRTLKSMAQYAAVPEWGDAAAWFNPVVPAGTAFDVRSRTQPDGTEPRIGRAEIAELRGRAPYIRHTWS